jgi:hypothetical protein
MTSLRMAHRLDHDPKDVIFNAPPSSRRGIPERRIKVAPKRWQPYAKAKRKPILIKRQTEEN